ncbi:uncharacterized protein LOC129766831, partial [Toxorhynchites rutilus septentrionalis]
QKLVSIVLKLLSKQAIRKMFHIAKIKSFSSD